MTRMPRFDRGPDWRRRQRRARWRRIAPFVGLALILLAWRAWQEPALREVIGLPLPLPDEVAERFALCAQRGHGAACVVDGDTYRLGQRRIRVAGIDAPEVAGACPAEIAAARRATLELQRWLNAGPFRQDTPEMAPRDQYGRELQQPWRPRADGGRDELARHMVAGGHAHPFDRGETRGGWC